MEALIVFGGAAAILAFLWPFARGAGKRQWASLGRALGLTDVRLIKDLGLACGVAGRRDGLRVEIYDPSHQARTAALAAKALVVSVTGGQVPEEIECCGEPSRGLLEANSAVPPESIAEREIELGDVRFDIAVRLRGSEPLLTALLDHETRCRLRSFVTLSGGQVVEGQVRATVLRGTSTAVGSLHAPANVKRILAAIGEAEEMAGRLARPADIVGRICVVAREDPHPSVRRHAVVLLAGRFPEDEPAREVLRECLTQRDDEGLRLLAAIALGEEGAPVLLETAQTPGDEERATRAIRALGRRLPSDRAVALLNESLRHGRRAVAFAVIETLGRRDEAEAHARLATVLSVGDAELAAAAAGALGESGDPKFEDVLIPAVRDARRAVRLAAVDALGRIGSAAAIGRLREAVTFGDRELGRAARRAIAQIQSRLPGASPGQLSIAAGDEGQLSMADDRSGRVSLPADPREDEG